MTGFLHFVSENRLKVKAQYPEKTHKEVISELGSMWSKMNVEEKKPYETKAQADKERYNREKAEYENKKQAMAQKVEDK